MTEEKTAKQAWTTPSLEAIEMKSTLGGSVPDTAEDFDGFMS